jgi:hypothetical protein
VKHCYRTIEERYIKNVCVVHNSPVRESTVSLPVVVPSKKYLSMKMLLHHIFSTLAIVADCISVHNSQSAHFDG